MQSIYVPVILHYIRVLGPNNVIVITTDQIMASSSVFGNARNSKERSKYTFQQLYKFMNLYAYDM